MVRSSILCTGFFKHELVASSKSVLCVCVYVFALAVCPSLVFSHVVYYNRQSVFLLHWLTTALHHKRMLSPTHLAYTQALSNCYVGAEACLCVGLYDDDCIVDTITRTPKCGVSLARCACVRGGVCLLRSVQSVSFSPPQNMHPGSSSYV